MLYPSRLGAFGIRPWGRWFKTLACQLGSGTYRLGAQLMTARWVADTHCFLKAFRANPKRIGAIAPSSAALGRAITHEITAHTGPVIELGVGTGVFTRALVKRGVAMQDLALVEMDPRFAACLKRDFPLAEHYNIDAAKLDRQTLFAGRQAGAVVCGLPLLNMPIRQQLGILRAAFSHVRAGGACYLFTYGFRCPVDRRVVACLGLRARKMSVVVGNLPPAHVWKLNRRGGSNRA